MKKIASFLLLALALTGCYKDKGNYEYTLGTMNEILKVTFSPAVENKVIEVLQPLTEDDTIRVVKAFVEQSLAKNLDNLEFYWCRSYVNEQGKAVKDTIRTKDSLEVKLPVGKPMSYDVFLEIYDTSTDLSHYSKFKISTRLLFKNSLFVLHGSEGERKLGNIEVIGSETKVYTDVKAVTRDENHYEDVTGLWYTTYNYVPEGGGYAFADRLVAYGDNDVSKVYNPHGMTLMYSAENMLKSQSDEFVYRRTMQAGSSDNLDIYRLVLTENGEVYAGNYVYVLYSLGAGCVNNPDIPHQSDYNITAAAITSNRYLMWDAKHGRFLYAAKADGGFVVDEVGSTNKNLVSQQAILDAYVEFDRLKKSPATMTAVLGYVNYRDNYDQQNAYFIFKDDAGSYYRYELQKLDGSKARARRNANRANEEKKEVAMYSIVSEKELVGLTPTDMSTITYNSYFTTSTLFFAEGSKVYRYAVDNGDKHAVYEAPEGYHVTKIKFRTEDSSNQNGDLGLYLDIVLFNGTNGAIAEIKFTNASDVDTDYPALLYEKDTQSGNEERWGEIKDIQFVYDFEYKKPDHWFN